MVSPRSLPVLSDDLLEEIFLRVGSPTDLARASTACVAFRRLIADPCFLRRYRSLHPPLFLGLLAANGRGFFQPAEAPHPSATLVRAADFSFDSYLPHGTGACLRVCDVRDGRVLLRYNLEDKEKGKFLPDLAVCDPLARRCLLLPPIHDDLLATVQVQKQNLRNFGFHFVPPGGPGGGEDGTSFRVIARMQCKEVVVVFIFSSATGHWGAGESISWDALSLPPGMYMVGCPLNYAYGCFYWKLSYNNKWLKFDISSMQFSAVDLPSVCDGSYGIIVEAGKGRLGMFSLVDGGTTLCYTIREIGSERSYQVKMYIPLPEGIYYLFGCLYEGHIFLFGYGTTGSTAIADGTCFTLEIKTLKIERIAQISFGYAFPYFGFLPSMLQRRI